MIKKHLCSLLTVALLSTAVGSSAVVAQDLGITAFYGDKALGRVVVMDVDNMIFKAEIFTQGIDPYPVDQAGKFDKVYAITRGSNSIDVIDSNTLEPMGLIELEHYPRSSEAFNETLGLQLVTGVDKPMATLIDVATDKAVASVGLNELFLVSDYGGSNATGHPFWFDENKFALIDRPNRMIHMYAVGKSKKHGAVHTKLLSSVPTPTAVHHFVKRDSSDNIFYALSEGSPDEGISPSVLKYILKRGKLHFVAEVALASENIYEMGSHHADMHPDGIHMYIGSTEGNIYVLNTKKMKIMKTIPVGLGAGHTTFVPERNIAIVTNHKDTFVSVVDTKKHTLIKNVTVSGPQINGAILQSHSTFVHPDMNFFYAFATDNGIFYELDLESLEVSRSVETGGTPLQGVFMCQGEGCENLM
ncbi:MAG: hypothetical protein COA44_08475 [Arcobacter sp.]|nr:MAG: hypothetical protein COA44_08475 [Arcobacter sp.]